VAISVEKARAPATREVSSVSTAAQQIVSASTQHVGNPTPPPAVPQSDTPAVPRELGELGPSSDGYPVNLDALRARLPGNRYWELGAPTSDPAVARVRAARAERDNKALGRILANEASPDEIHAYYRERRAVSRDYLELSELVLREQGDQLPERDRGMFELSVNLHRARLQQIDRDESDALIRIHAR